MTALTAQVVGDAIHALRAVEWGEVRSHQAWVLEVMREDGPGVVRLLWRMLGREPDVLDAYQDCFCRLMAVADREGERPSRAYVYRTAMNIALDARRRRKVRADHLGQVSAHCEATAGESNPFRNGGGSADPDLVSALREAIESLPERLREVIVLRDLAELSYRDVAALLGLTEGTARVYRREAVVLLSDRLKG